MAGDPAVPHAGDAAVQLEPDDIAALVSAVAKLKANDALIHEPELSFFKDILTRWAAGQDAGAPGHDAPAGDTSSTKHADAASDNRKASNSVMELESDDEELVMQPREMELPHGLLEEEFADEPQKDSAAKEEDPERLPKDPGPFPALPPFGHTEPSDARKRVLLKVKEQAGEALARGGVNEALDKYTDAIRAGGASALMLATRAALLLKLRRPCAAIRDCCAALALNQDCGKAYHVRGVAHRKLGHWKRAHRDLSAGQRLDFSEDSVEVHMFVAKKVGALEDTKTGRWYAKNEGAKKAVELLLTAEGAEKRKRSQSSDLRPSQAVRINGLQKAPHLNGKRGIILRLNPKDAGRWDVEIRLENGRLETKAIKGENILPVRAADAKRWTEEEQQHEEERVRRQKADKRWQEEEDRQRRLNERNKAMRGGAFPDMDSSEKLEAEMSGLQLDDEAMKLLRRLRAKDALEVLSQAGIASIGGNLSTFVKIKAKQRLGEPDSDDEPEEGRRRAEQAARAAAEIAAEVELRVKARAAAEERETQRRLAEAARRRARSPSPAKAKAYDPEESPSDESSDEDFDHLDAEKEQVPSRGFIEHEPSDSLSSDLARWKNEAMEALEAGELRRALEKYTQVISRGGATALMLTKRAELLLKLRRPCGAISDCTAAVQLNPDLGKAFRVRGIANRKLGRWTEADRDLSEAQRLDYDEGTAAVQKFVAAKVGKAAKRQRTGFSSAPPSKRSR